MRLCEFTEEWGIAGKEKIKERVLGYVQIKGPQRRGRAS